MMINMINQAADSWFSFMAHATWQATATSLLILAVVWRAQRLPANVRYLLLLVALAKFLAPPFLSSPIGAYSQVRLADATIQPALHTIEISHGDEPPSMAVAESKFGTLDEAAASTTELGTVREQRSKGRDNSSESAFVATAMSLPRSPLGKQLSWQAWLMMLYAFGAVLAVSWMANGAYHLRRIIRRCQRVSAERRDEFLALARLMGIVRPVRLLVSCDPVMPMACGVFRPTVIISKSMMEQLSRPERRAILAHELAHHRRFDPAILWIQGVVLTMWWFHPLAWWLNRTLLRVREQCCDDIVIVENVATREGYCAALVRAVTWHEVRTRFLGCAATRMGPLGNRIARAMDPHVRHSAAVTPLGWGFAILTCLVMLPGLAIHSSHALAVNSATTAEEDQGNDERGLETAFKPGDIGGRVVDERAKPVEATVWMGRKKSDNWVFKSTSTNPDGHFRFSNVDEGHVTLTAVSNGRSLSGIHFSVQEGQIERNLELVVTPTTTLAIRIRDEGGAPISGAEVATINWTLPERSRYWLPLEVLDLSKLTRPKSEGDGVLTIPWIPEQAKCNVVVKHEKFVPGLIENIRVADVPPSLTLDDGLPIVVRAIDGHTGMPVTDATVTISGVPESINVYDQPVDEQGEFHTRFPVSPRRVTIRVNHPELVTTKWIPLSGGTGSGDYEFKLYRRGRVHGRVIHFESGDPCAGVPIHIVSDRQVVARSWSRDDGYFEISAPAGRFTLSVSTGNGFYAERGTKRSIQIKPGEATEVSDLPARQLPRIEGVVLMPSGEPAARTLVVYDERGVDPQLTDENGRFEFQVIRKDDAGVHLRVSHLTERLSTGRAIAMDEVMLGRQVQIQLQPESDLFGTVVDFDGNPLAGVHVSLGVRVSFGPRGQVGTMSSHSRGGSTVTDSAGVYRFRGLSRHRYYRASVGSPLSKTSVRSPYVQPDQPVVQLDPLQISDLKAAELGTPTVDAPEIVCREWMNSSELGLRSLRGKVVLLDFWATWCGPCIVELPHVQTAHELFEDNGLVVIGLHHNSVPAHEVRAFAKAQGLTYAIGLDTKTGATCGNYDVTAFPTKILIDRDGKIVPTQIRGSNLLATLRRVLLYGDE